MNKIYESYKNILTPVNESKKYTLLHKLEVSNLPVSGEVSSGGVYSDGKNVIVRLFDEYDKPLQDIELGIDYKKHLTKKVLSINKQKYSYIQV